MAVPVRFGTDGIRGQYPEAINTDLAYRLGRAVARVFDAVAYVGYDTRESSPLLCAAVLAGLAAEGATGVNLGVFTTPGVAVVARERGGVGVIVSASHNPYRDNGLKVVGPGGTKLDHASEALLEAALNEVDPPATFDFPAVAVDTSAQHEYAAHLRALVARDLRGLHVVLDCANGAASYVAHELFESTGATLTIIHDEPTGRNINEGCGSTHPDDLVAVVREHGADLGLAFDGDADRLIAVDDHGQVRDGDDLMVLFALDALARGREAGLVVTSMSNLGLRRAMQRADIELIETDVGDRNVLIALEERGWPFGGEQSGHLIFRDVAPTGDGLLTGLFLCDLVARRGPLAALADAAWERLPQRLINVARDRYDDAAVRERFDALRASFALSEDDVRLLIRPSGTEPVVRVMVEALDADFVAAFATSLEELFPTR